METEHSGITPAVKSVLYKPLHELTEDDISQLTREDCRRFLKEKGMRRPSWNKSQAIQQVISLKSLLEPSPPNAAVRRSFRPPPPPLNSVTTNNTFTVNSNSSSSVKELSPVDVEGSVTTLGEGGCPNQPGEGGCPTQPEGLSSLNLARGGECHADNTKRDPDRCKDASNLQFDKMTVFYSGKVNVYDGVPVDKARAVMHLAASSIQFCQDEPSGESLPNLNIPCQLPTSSVTLNLATPDAPGFQSWLPDVDGQTNRQVSLQRYFDKRKDRGKFKMKKKTGAPSSSLEMYLSHQMKSPIISRQNSESNTSATSQLGAAHTGFESKQNHLKNSGLSVDLNDKGGSTSHVLLCLSTFES